MVDKKSHWQHIYQDKSPRDASWYQDVPELSLALIQRCHLQRHEAIIDVGGGTSMLVDCLCKEGYTNLSVLDISATALDFTKERLGDLAATVHWFETDITAFKPPHPFYLWHDRAVFHFLTDESDREKYVQTLKHSLLPGGHLIVAAFATGGPKKCSGLDIVQYDATKLMAELGSEFELIEEIYELHTTPSNEQQKFTYYRLTRR